MNAQTLTAAEVNALLPAGMFASVVPGTAWAQVRLEGSADFCNLAALKTAAPLAQEFNSTGSVAAFAAWCDVVKARQLDRLPVSVQRAARKAGLDSWFLRRTPDPEGRTF
jgi:hypothetical protein